MNLSSHFLIQSTGGIFYGLNHSTISSIQIDSRDIQENDCFAALSGLKTCGYYFLKDVIEKKACGIIVDTHGKKYYDQLPIESKNKTWCIVVDDVVKALHLAAKQWRSLFSIPIIGITGSMGKTTTKEYAGQLAKSCGLNPLITKKSMNGLLGLPLTVLGIKEEHSCAICEVGISQIGEMAVLADILRPTCAIITKIGRAHIEGLGSIENIWQEKSKICLYMNEKNKIIIPEELDSFLPRFQHKATIIKCGETQSCNFIKKIDFFDDYSRISIQKKNESHFFTMKTKHKGLLSNAFLAIAAVSELGISLEAVCSAFESDLQVSGRFEILYYKNYDGYIVNDSYNASFESITIGLDAFYDSFKNKKMLLVLGEMREMGDESDFLHKNILENAITRDQSSMILAIGQNFYKHKSFYSNKRIIYLNTAEDAIPYIEKALSQSYAILLKGARAMALEKSIESLYNS